jgi:phosphoenolpyruvate-protein phosphotransferase (PTS system enzyme I)
MQILQGIPVSPGVAIGEALILDNEGFQVPRHTVATSAVEDELLRLTSAIEFVTTQLHSSRDAISRELGKQYGAIFDAHDQLLHDPRLRSEMEQHIREQHHTPELAVSRTLRKYAKVFQDLGDPHLSQRASDLFDLEKRLLGKLLGLERQELLHLVSPVIVLAHDLTPGETATMNKRFVLGFATEIGGAGGHTAIVAKGRDIPAVVGIGNFLSEVSGGDVIIIDGDHGQVYLQPDDATLARYHRVEESHRTQIVKLRERKDLPAVTADNKIKVEVLANIEFPNETESCFEFGADGIGLYRTEFLYLTSDTIPNEEDHYQAYAQVVQAMQSHPVVIRTLDLGADKLPQPWAWEAEPNPFLGLRSVRLTLRNIPLFRTQLRAILRASLLGNVKIMFPLITTLQEWRQARLLLNDVQEDLHHEGINVSQDIPVGIMVETPAAVMMLDKFLEEVDFISIGTNDLIQYALAVDRSNRHVAELYQCGDPAVLRMIRMAIREAVQAEVPVSLCGQMSAISSFIPLLLGLGLRSLSVPPSRVPEIKQICRSMTQAQCTYIAERALELESSREVETFLREELRKAAPEWAEDWS